MPPSDAPGPLAGIRVVDCSTVLAGPFATMLMADLGADVIKVEPFEGDATRGWGPPWVGDEAAGTRTAAYYLSVNRNKRALRLDLRQAEGRDVLRRLLADADVLVENFRVGAFARLGFDDASLAAVNPDLVHLAISGFGADGPDADKPGYDLVAQAAGGLMSITGEGSADGGRPMKVGVAISDVVTGLFASVAILSGLLGRQRGRAPGQRIDVSILESTLAILVNQAQNAFIMGRAPDRLGNAHPNLVPYETFATADRALVVAVASEQQWSRFCNALGVSVLATDPRFADNGRRVDRRDELHPILAEVLAQRTTAAWLAALEAADVPVAAVNDVAAAFASPQAVARGMTVEVEHPAFGVLRQVGIPFRLSATPATIRSAPPLLGEHSDEILSEAGYPPEAIAGLRERGVI